MITCFRIVQTEWAASAMNGEGARLFGGRWNPPGFSAVYLAGSRALAALEIIVHAPREVVSLDWCIIEVELSDELIESVKPAELPPDWQALPSSLAARKFGEKWLRGRSALALKLPSVIIPEENVYLLNPLHSAAAKLRVSKQIPFRFDGSSSKIGDTGPMMNNGTHVPT